jgi:hypothetical protein
MNMTTTTPTTPQRGNRTLKFLGWTLLATLVAAALLVAAAVSIAGHMDPGFIELNGQPLAFGNIDAGDWIVGIGGILIAIVVVLFVVVVVPLAVMIPVGFALFGIAVALVAVAGAALLAFSPLIILVGGIWLIVRLLRGNERKRSEARAQKNAAGSGATIAG